VGAIFHGARQLPKYGPQKSGYDRFYGFIPCCSDYFNHKDLLWDGSEKADDNGYLTDLLADRAATTVAEFARARTPFLISLHFNAPHWPWEGPEDQEEARRVTPPGGGGLIRLLHYDGGSLATYAKMVLAMDAAIGRVLTALARAGVAQNTIVIFTSDNGGERYSDTWPFSGKKQELLEGGIRIPAIVRWPGHHRQERRVAFASGGLSRLNVLRGLDQRDGTFKNLGRANFGSGFSFSAYGLHRHPVGEDRVVPDLIEFARSEIQAGGD
jgi:hypothetical protein